MLAACAHEPDHNDRGTHARKFVSGCFTQTGKMYKQKTFIENPILRSTYYGSLELLIPGTHVDIILVQPKYTTIATTCTAAAVEYAADNQSHTEIRREWNTSNVNKLERCIMLQEVCTYVHEPQLIGHKTR